MELFKIFGTLALKGMDQFKKDADESKNKGKELANAIGKGLATAAKVGAAAVTAASAAVGGLIKQSISSYAEFEQLVGGTELLFGDAYDYIMQKSKNAYRTVQMSQNDYLQQVNGFATGLKTALGGNEKAAAELADRIITAEADIVAATGNSKEAVQNAFNGIMKSNFSMLDNLQLGITPTKEGFQEVIDKVNEWNKANGKATKYQIDNLADCQSALLDYVEMQGLSGYAANEAAGTIQGSLGMVKGAWENLVSGLADKNADIRVLVFGFVDSFATAGENLLPTIEHALQGIEKLVKMLVPMIGAALPMIINSILPIMLQAGISLITSLLEGIRQNIGAMTTGAFEIIMMLIQGIVELIPLIITTGFELLIGIIEGLASNPDAIVDTAISLIVTLTTGLIEAMPQLIAAAGTLIAALIGALISKLPDILQAGKNLLGKVIEGIEQSLVELDAAGQAIVDAIKDGIAKAWNSLVTWFEGIWNKLFGNRTVNVNLNGNDNTGSTPPVQSKNGLDHVPYDGFHIVAHEGEAVLTKEEAKAWRAGNGGNGVTVIQYISAVPQTPVQLASATAAYFEQARWAL